jgi:hypothetical protein
LKAHGRYQTASQQPPPLNTDLREAEEALRAAETAYQLGERGSRSADAQRVLRVVSIFSAIDRQAALIDLNELRAVEFKEDAMTHPLLYDVVS